MLIPYLNKYPLTTQKRADYELFAKIVNRISEQRHLTLDGLQEIVNFKASMNIGLSDRLKKYFSNVIPYPRPQVASDKIQDPQWLSGFTEREGCFFVRNISFSKSKLGIYVQFELTIVQHVRDIAVLEGIKTFFGCGRVEKHSAKAHKFVVNSFTSMKNIIVPFYKQYTLQGQKRLEFEDFNMVLDIMLSDGHLTKQGLERIE